MALIKCEECGHDVSTKAANCPNCGAPVIESANPSDTVAKTNKLPARKARALTYFARVYFIGGFFVLLSIWPLGGFTVGKLAGPWLFIGLGIALLAYGYSRSSRDWIRTSVIAVGWLYTVLITIVIIRPVLSS